MIFINTDPRYAGRLDNKHGGDTIMTMERLREAITFSAELVDTWQVDMVVAHVGANGLCLETNRLGAARGESRAFRQQPKGT